LNGPNSLALVGTDLFVTNYVGGTIGKYTTAGVTVNASLVTGLNGPSGIAVSDPLQLSAATSRKTHGAAGVFGINLPLTGEPGVECRSSSCNHTLAFIFNNDLVGGTASVTSGTGTVAPGSPFFQGSEMIVNLIGVADVQQITVTLSNVTDIFAQIVPSASVSVNMLIGDTTGNKSVNAGDVAQTKGQSGLPVGPTNLRNDVTAGGSINASDVALVKANSGHSVP
jgi:hypothetical protein